MELNDMGCIDDGIIEEGIREHTEENYFDSSTLSEHAVAGYLKSYLAELIEPIMNRVTSSLGVEETVKEVRHEYENSKPRRPLESLAYHGGRAFGLASDALAGIGTIYLVSQPFT